MRHLWIPLFALLLGGTWARAEDPPGPTDEPAARAAEVIEAARAGTALAELAARSDVDPWLVADLLLAGGHADLARAYAAATPATERKPLLAYLATDTAREAEPKLQEACKTAAAALRKRRPEDALVLLRNLSTTLDRVVRIRLHHLRAHALRALHRLPDSVRLYREVAQAAEKLGWLARASDAWHDCGTSAYDASLWNVALEAWRRRLSIEEGRNRRETVAVILGNLGLVQAAMGQYAEALKLHRKALRESDALGNMAGVAVALGNLGNAYHDLGQYEKALEYHKRALALHRAQGEQARIANELGNIANVHAAMGDHANALALHEEAASIWTRLGSEVGAARTETDLGITHGALGHYEEAILHLERAIRLHEAHRDRAMLSRSLRGLGTVRTRLGQLEAAEVALERARGIDETSSDARGLARTLRSLALVQRLRGRYDEAIATCEKALSLARAQQDRHTTAEILRTLGGCRSVQGRWKTARDLFTESLEMAESLGDRSGIAKSLGNLGLAESALGNKPAALELQQRALKLKEELGDLHGRALTLGNIGVLYKELGDYGHALEVLTEARQTHEHLGNRGPLAKVYGDIGGVHYAMGAYDEALAWHTKALELNRRLGVRAGIAQALGNMGNVHWARGDYQRAIQLYQRTLRINQELGRGRGVARALSNLGIVYRALGEFARALDYHERALRLKQDLKDRAGEARSLGNIANVYMALGDYERALKYQERVFALMEEQQDRPGMARTLGNMGIVYRCLENHIKALQVQHLALSVMRELGDRAGEARTLGNIGTCYRFMGKYPEALQEHTKALEIKRELGDRAGIVNSLTEIGIVRRLQGDDEAAIQHLDQAVRQAERIRARPIRVWALTQRAIAYLGMDRPALALSDAHRALEAAEGLLGGLAEQEGASARERFAALFGVGALAASRLGQPAEIAYFVENGRAGSLLESLDGRMALRDTVLPEALRKAEREARRAESNAAAELRTAEGRDAPLDERREKARILDEARERVQRVIERIQREAKRAAEVFYPRAATLDEIQQRLEPSEAILLYAFALDRALALVVTKEDARVVDLGPNEEITAVCAALVLHDPQDDPTETLKALRAKVADPLKLPPTVHRVLISPTAALSYVPFVLMFPEQTVSYVPSGTTAVALVGEARHRGSRILALGDPDYGTVVRGPVLAAGGARSGDRGRRFAPLPMSREEAKAVGEVVLLGPAACEEELRRTLAKAKSEGRRWRAVHFACHGFVDRANPAFSSLVLAPDPHNDGFLRVQEVFRMDIPADLVVLSACETGRGRAYQGEGLVGLTRAFMFAGTPRVICSLWKVDDEATRALMVAFYERWHPKQRPGVPRRESMPAAEALRAAQEVVRSNPRWKHPYYWAAWVLWGLPD